MSVRRRKGISGITAAAALIFAAIILVFILCIFRISGDTDARQKEALSEALSRNILYCYTIEGSYPESLEYIQENYPLVYDTDRFYIDYRTNGANIYPEVTVIDLEEN